MDEFKMSTLAEYGDQLKTLWPHPLVSKLIDRVVAGYEIRSVPLPAKYETIHRSIVWDRLTILAGCLYKELQRGETVDGRISVVC